MTTTILTSPAVVQNFFSNFQCWRKKKIKQSHNGQVVPLSIVGISSLLIIYGFKQFEIIVTFNPTKINYEHPIYLLTTSIEKCIKFLASTYLVTASQVIHCWMQCKRVKLCIVNIKTGEQPLPEKQNQCHTLPFTIASNLVSVFTEFWLCSLPI